MSPTNLVVAVAASKQAWKRAASTASRVVFPTRPRGAAAARLGGENSCAVLSHGHVTRIPFVSELVSRTVTAALPLTETTYRCFSSSTAVESSAEETEPIVGGNVVSVVVSKEDVQQEEVKHKRLSEVRC